MNKLKHYLELLYPVVSFQFKQPTIVFQSDDWGFTGIPDAVTYTHIQQSGLSLGQHAYDTYSLETKEDLEALYTVLLRHKDSRQRPPVFVFNFILANLNFADMKLNGYRNLSLLPLHQGLPEPWSRPGLWEAYQDGIDLGLVYPALHGRTHFCFSAAQKVVQEQSKRRDLLVRLYQEGISLLYAYTPWLGFEFRSDEGDGKTWLPFQEQVHIIDESIALFEQAFDSRPLSVCPPGYRANDDTVRAWARAGLRIVQGGPGIRAAPYRDRYNLLHLQRNVILEPALSSFDQTLQTALQEAEVAIMHKRPVIISMHSINFQSAVINHRDYTLKCLDRFLTLLEMRYKDLLYAHDGDLLKQTDPRFGYNVPSIPITAHVTISPLLSTAIFERLKRSYKL